MSAVARLAETATYVPPERSGDPVRTGTLFPIALGRWQHHTAGATFEQLVTLAGECFATALEEKADDTPFDVGPADVAAILTIICDRRREMRDVEARVLAGLLAGPDVHDVHNSVEKRA